LDLSNRVARTNLEENRMRRMRTLLTATRVFAGIISLTSFILVISSVDTSIWNFQSFWYGMKFFIFLFELLFLLLGYGIALLLGWGDNGAVAIMTAIHNVIFGGNETILGIPIESLITNPLQLPTQQNLIDAIYAFFIIVAIIIAIISAIGFLRECNPALSAITFFSLNVVLGLASLNGKLLLDLDFANANFIQLIFSKLVMTGFIIYFSLELSFQASYIYNVIGPNLQRGRRITSNIKRIKEHQMVIGPKKETKEEDETFIVKGKNTSASRLKITTAFSQVKALVGKKLFRISPEEDWDKINNRLKNFYLKLEENDPLISVSLSASAYTPSLTRLALIITSGTLFRMAILMVLAWLALNPIPVLTFLNFPNSIVQSVEAGQPEMIILVLVPMAIMFMIIGLIVQFIQRRVSKRMTDRAQKLIIHPIKEGISQETRETTTELPTASE